MRRTTKSSVALALVLLVAGCESASTTTSHSGAPGEPSSTTSPSIGPSKLSTTAGLTQAFAVGQSCDYVVPFTGGLFGNCIIAYGPGYDPISGLSLIRNDGTVVPFPGPKSVRPPSFRDNAGDLVAMGTVNSTASALLVFEPTSGAVKKAIPLPTPRPRLIGVTGTTAILAREDNWVMAYDLSGAKKWEVPFSGFMEPIRVVVTPAGVLVFQNGNDSPVPPTTPATMLRLDDGSALWTGTGQGLNSVQQRLGRTVFYDNVGVARSLATGEPTGPGASASPPASSSAGVAYQDDLIITNPLRRITPQGEPVWTLEGTSGTPATDGKTLAVHGTDDLVVLDPSTGRRLGQAPAPFGNNSCSNFGGTYLLVASPLVVLAGLCPQSGTAVYTFNP